MNFVLFVCGAFALTDLPLPMRVSVGEILAFIVTAILWIKHWPKLPQRRLTLFVGVIGLFVSGVILSDSVNGTPLVYHFRGISKPIFVALHAAFFIAVLERGPSSIRWYFYGRVLSAAMNYLFPGAYTSELLTGSSYSAIAFGIAPLISVSGVALAIWLYRRSRTYAAVVLALSGMGLIAVGAPRNSALTLLLIGLVTIMFFRDEATVRRRGVRTVMLLSLVSGLALWGFYRLYVFTASREALNELQTERYELQARQYSREESLIALLAAGRTEVYAAILAISDEPILGYGSWAGSEMTEYFYKAIVSISPDTQTVSERTEAGTRGVAGHSIFFTGWMENGILAAMGLVGLLLMTARVAWKGLLEDSPDLLIIIIVSMTLAWDWFFSPFSVTDRIYFGLIGCYYVSGVPKAGVRRFRSLHLRQEKARW
jgi:hypothetical protein